MARNTETGPRLNSNTLLNIYRGGTQYPGGVRPRTPGGTGSGTAPTGRNTTRPGGGTNTTSDTPPVANSPATAAPNDPNSTTTTGGAGGYADPYDARVGGGALPEGISGTQNRAYTRQPTEEELVENRLVNLTNGNSRYMQSATQRALEQSANRGLLNSSIAVGASQRAAIDAALPIASQDAATWAGAQSQNQSALNERAIADLRAAVDRASIGASIAIAGMNNAGALQRQREGMAFEGEQNQLDRDQQNYRDYNMYRYDVGRDVIGSQLRLGERRAQFGYDLIDLAVSDPEMYSPDVIGALYNTFGPLLDMDFESFGRMFAGILGG